MTDKEIILKIKSGEIDYYKYIVNRYYSFVYQLIKRKVFNIDDIDDLTQNVFIGFYKNINKFNQLKPVKPYLYQIVLNELKMYYRRYKKTLSLNENIKVGDDDFLEKIINQESLLEKIFLNEKEKRIIDLLLTGYRYQEIGQKLKIPLNTVKSIIRRLRLKIKRMKNEKQ